MDDEIHFRLHHARRLLSEGRIAPPFIVGRQTSSRESPPVQIVDSAAGVPDPPSPHHPERAGPEGARVAVSGEERKLVIAPLGYREVPRRALRVHRERSGQLVVENLHDAVELLVLPSHILRPGERRTLDAAGEVYFPGDFRLRLSTRRPESKGASEKRDAGSDSWRTNVIDAKGHATPDPLPARMVELDESNFYLLDAPDDPSDIRATRLLSMVDEDAASNRQKIAINLVRTALEAFKEPPGSRAFLAAAGRAAIQMIDMDRVAVLRKEGTGWRCSALSFRPGLDETRAAARDFCQPLLARMEATRRTIVIDPHSDAPTMLDAIGGVDRAVASPILDQNMAIIGALYGDRLVDASEDVPPIGELEAALLEVISSGISSSLAIKREQRLRSTMGQFFSPVVLSQLQRDPSLLEGRETEVSVLFCDIRGYSAITEQIGPARAIAWINDVLTSLSQCVLDFDGVLVDYIGDELMAMWGAPGDQPDHAPRACRAALEMLKRVDALEGKWHGELPNPFGIGIGINSGLASVGNTGSKQKFKYGPIGNTVNLASRVQGITKQVGLQALATGSTALAAQHGGMSTRRLARARVVGIQQPIDLYELCASEADADLAARYEVALEAYERNDLKTAAGRLASLVQDFPEDRPTIILLSRTVQLLTQPDGEFDPVWNLPNK